MSTEQSTITDLDQINVDGVLNTAEPVVEETLEATEPVVEPVVEPVAPLETTTPAVEYVPDYKYSVDETEYDIDPMFHSIMKDKETEDKLKDILLKAQGLEFAKQTRDEKIEKYKTRSEEYLKTNEELSSNYNKYASMFNPAIELMAKGDAYGAAKALGFEGQDLLAMAEKEIEYRKSSPEQRAFIDNQARINTQNVELMKSNATLQQKELDAQTEAVNAFMSVELNNPEVRDVLNYVDTVKGVPGSFRKRVTEYGTALWQQTKGKASLSQVVTAAVNEAMNEYKSFMPQKQVTTENVVPLSPVTNATTVVKKPTIPHVPSGGSPGKAKIMSLEDLPDS